MEETSVTISNVLRRKAGDRIYFFGTLTSDIAKSVSFVPVLENSAKTPLNEITEDGYQRPGSNTRMNKFKIFLVDHPECLVPPVLLSARGSWVFTAADPKFPDFGSLEIRGQAAILDGQHRMGGYVALFEAEEEVRNVDFIALAEITLQEEIREFITVNDSQVGVPKSLSGFLGIDIGDDEDDSAWLAWQLNVRADSPFEGRITRTKMAPTHLFALHSVAKQIGRMFSHGAFTEATREEKLEILIKYWNLIADAHSEIWQDIEKLGVKGQGRKAFSYKLLELTGFIAWSMIANSTIVSNNYNAATRTVDWEAVSQHIDKLAEKFDWRKDGEFIGLTGEVGGPKIKSEMERILAS